MKSDLKKMNSTGIAISVALFLCVSLSSAETAANNLALGKTCTSFSSIEADGWSVQNLTDGRTGGIGYSSKSFDNYGDHQLYPQFVVVDLGHNASLSRVFLHPRGDSTMAGKGFPEDFTIEVCREGEPWRVIVEQRGYPALRSGLAQTFDLKNTEGRYVKIEATRLRMVEEQKYRFQLAEIQIEGVEKAVSSLTREMPVTNNNTQIKDLKCEHYVNPVGIDVEHPRFDWILDSAVRGQRQTAYRVLVAMDSGELKAGRGDVWDSGKVSSDQSVAVRYAGQALASGKQYHWKVMVWDKDGQPVAWSEPAVFVTGKLKPKDWKGQWIGANIGANAATAPLGFAVVAGVPEETKWIQVDLGAVKGIDKVVLHPMQHKDPPAGGLIKGHGFPVRFRLEVSDQADFSDSRVIADHTQSDYPNPGHVQIPFDTAGTTGRYVRLTATKLWSRGPGLGYAFTLGEMQVFSGGQNIALEMPVSANDSYEGSGWAKAHLTNGKTLAPVVSMAGDEPPAELKYPEGAIYLRKPFQIDKPVTRATVFFCGLGRSELSIDGVKVGLSRMDPGFTTYNKRVQYLAYDVTDRFSNTGEHVLGMILVNGWYGQTNDDLGHGFNNLPYVDKPKMLLNLHLEHPDGSETVVVSDPSWRWSQGEITRSYIAEEDIDLRAKQKGWDRGGFDDSLWHAVATVKGPKGKLVRQREVPTTARQAIRPATLRRGEDGKSWLYDFGREFNGSIRFRTSGPAGTQIKLTILAPIGSEACPSRVNMFTLAGKSIEQYASRFCNGSITRVLVEGVATPPSIDDLDAEILSGVGKVSGSFRCSNDVLNWLHESARRTQQSFVTFLPNDPTREYKAWMEDPQNMFVSAVYLFDSRAMYERWQYDMLDGQQDDGNGANIAPGPSVDAYNSPWWGGCLVWVPWHWYLYYGDASLLLESYDGMKKYVDYLGVVGKDYMQGWGLNDWCSIEYTPPEIINTPAYYLYALVVSRTAELLGRTEDADRYAQLAQKVREKYNQKFLDTASGVYGIPGTKTQIDRWSDTTRPEDVYEEWYHGDRPCTQAGQAVALALGLVPENLRSKVESALLREIAAYKNHISTGFVGTPHLLQVLADLAPEVGYAVTTAKDYPSWYSMTAGSAGLSKMAVVDRDLMQEGWCGRPVMMPSLGGNIAGWNMESLGGIRPDPDGPGFKRFMVKPNVVSDLHWSECSFDSVHGQIISNWYRRGDEILMKVTIPANTTATVWVPARDAALVKENGVSAAQAAGVKYLRTEDNHAVFKVGGGVYRFESHMSWD